MLSALLTRALERSRRLSVRTAIAQVPSLPARVEAVLWHLADRWGRREAGRVVLQFRLSQGLLAELAAAHPRTSVNVALRHLADRGVVATTPDGRLALCGQPPGHVELLSA